MKRLASGLVLELTLLILLLPVLQLGVTYYLSAHLVALLLLCAILVAYPSRAQLNPVICIALFLAMAAPLLWVLESTYFVHSALRNVREFACLVIILAIIQKSKSTAFVANMAPVKVAIGVIIVACFGFVILQAYFLSKGALLFVPSQYYVTNASTLPDEVTLLGSYLPRPSGFFGEPSYMGFIATSLVLISLRVLKRGALKVGLIAMCIAIVIICKTLAGIMAVTALLLFAWYRHWGVVNKPIKRLFVALTVIGYIAVIVTTQVSVLGRLGNINDSEKEASGYTRLVVPLALAVDVLRARPLGVPADETLNLFGNAGPFYDALTRGTTDNGLINLFINYGISAFLILFVLYRGLDDAMLAIYLLFAMMFNGDFLSYDKAAVIGLVLLLYRGVRQWQFEIATSGAVDPRPAAMPRLHAVQRL